MHRALAHALALTLDTLLLALPPSALLGLCAGLGRLGYYVLPARRAVALENLRLALGRDHELQARERLARESFAHMGRLVAELVLAPRLLTSLRQRARRIRLRGNWQELEQRMGHTGGLLVTAHLGNWEVGAHVARAHGMRLRPMFQPPRSLLARELLGRWRAGGSEAFPKVGGLREALTHLGSGGWIGMLADQNAGRHGTFVPFLGLPASTFPTPIVLALRLGTPLYVGICVRAPGNGLGFDAWIEELVLEPPPVAVDATRAPASDRVQEGTAALNRLLERYIRLTPAQYQWPHRRYKLRPPGSQPGPDQPFYGRFATPPPASRAARSAGTGSSLGP